VRAFLQVVDRYPARVAVALTTILAVIEMAVLMLPLLADSTLIVALLLPIVGAFAGGLLVRSWWWPLIYVAGSLAGMALWMALGMRDDGVLDAGNVAGGVIAGSSVILPPVILFVVIGPLLATIHRRFGARQPAPSTRSPDQGTV
jgi:hypothetical protein